ncbi:energy transducer TonB [Sphingosinithalassobacter sp. CS137]|uniref:energy transducer TonB family protein n=1 Tax=Sphingosinithalassobacter sp. CS137 TaxID=2762748 RepID=UPI00165E68BE|nr:energy transducer TonB [Sphingosinithalassobacter sp. CS137]
MISPLLLLAAVAMQDVPAQDTVFEEEAEAIVVQATVGRVALLFDRAADGRLENCRVFVSSGVDSLDAEACATVPDCAADVAEAGACIDVSLVTLAPRRAAAAEAAPAMALTLPKLVEPRTAAEMPAVGPAVRGAAEDDPNRLPDLPPPPRDMTSAPAITFGPGPDTMP